MSLFLICQSKQLIQSIRYGLLILFLCLIGCGDVQHDGQVLGLGGLIPVGYHGSSSMYIASENINKIPCPKLLPLSDGGRSVMYHDRMFSDSCDYYVYLRAGQSFYLTTSHRSIQASVISPDTHQFAQGSMLVRQTGRHIIRLKRHYHFGNNDRSIAYVLRLEVSEAPSQTTNDQTVSATLSFY